ncbi:MAG: DUF2147 domain-containing protein [Oceanospirillaceae bacterium]|nr:DUF2147 domain-containing protein [Oceanospirillaceae bacterium]
MKNSLDVRQGMNKAKVAAIPLVNPVMVVIKATLLSALVAFIWVLSTSLVLANGDEIIGSWLTPDDKAVVEIYQQDGEYFGKFVSLKEPLYPAGDKSGLDGQAKVDRNNPDATQHTQPIIGLVMLNGMEYAGQKKGKHQWQGGTIYDPGNGKAYKCTIKLNADGTLDLRGYIGISLFGRSQTWRPNL